jgi:hypothetical protein
METCKAIIQEGPRKGKSCEFPPNSTMYCGRHQRNKMYDDGVAEGKKWCRFFFRGCDTVLDPASDASSCEKCKDALSNKKNACNHEGCKFKTNDTFCKKHERDVYYIEEKEKGVRYCDIARGCFTILNESKKSCDDCLEKIRKTDSARYKGRKELIMAAQASNSTTRSCIKCTKEFQAFKTCNEKDSVHCKLCLEKHTNQDRKREGRVRNYKEERLNNLESSYKVHISESLKRGYGDFQLNFDDFKELVTSPCHYCKIKKESEAIGIDRVNNDIGYVKENCVPACWKCNRMKHFYHPAFFIEKCKIIAKKLIPDNAFYNRWSLYYSRSCYRNYTTYKREAEGRNIAFEITQQQWDWITRSQCYLCGFQNPKGIGIDRQDNTVRSYTIENCRPCCGSCNSMKNELSLQDLLEHCKVVSDAYPTYEHFSSIPILKNPLKVTIKEDSDRSHWKSSSIYYAIISDSAGAFYDAYKPSLSEDEYIDLCNKVKSYQKDAAHTLIEKLLKTLRKRRYRQANTSKTPEHITR